MNHAEELSAAGKVRLRVEVHSSERITLIWYRADNGVAICQENIEFPPKDRRQFNREGAAMVSQMVVQGLFERDGLTHFLDAHGCRHFHVVGESGHYDCAGS